MITLHLTPDDLAKSRFGYSQIGELFASIYVLRNSWLHTDYSEWVSDALSALQNVDFPYIAATLYPYGYPANFVFPKPSNAPRSFETELDQLRTVSLDLIRREMESVVAVYAENGGQITAAQRHFLVYPRDALDCLIDEIRLYWQLALAPHWPRIRSVLDQDILYRARHIALQGTESMVADLGTKIRYQAGKVELLSSQPNLNDLTDYTLDGKGIEFVPTLFRLPCMVLWQLNQNLQSSVIYSARGGGLWQSRHIPDPEQALVDLLGSSRATMLVALAEPAHTSQLATMLHMTAGAVSQHLSILNRAGMVESRRSGHRVYYQLTQKGQQLLDLFTN